MDPMLVVSQKLCGAHQLTHLHCNDFKYTLHHQNHEPDLVQSLEAHKQKTEPTVVEIRPRQRQ